MEFLSVKKNRNRKKKRNVRKRRRERIKLEVKSIKSQRLIAELANVSFSEEKIIKNTMQADAFWKNYAAAQEWQKRYRYVQKKLIFFILSCLFIYLVIVY